MKFQKRTLCIISILCLVLSGCGCAPKDDSVSMYISGTEIAVTEDLLLQTADLIVKGKVIEQKEDYFSNPDGKKLQQDGSEVMNARITEYVFKVEQVYKGEWSESTLSFKTYNDQGLSVEQALTGQDENAVVHSEIDELELSMGECILALSWFEAEAFGGPASYMVTFDDCGYFLPAEDGLYENAVTGNNHLSVYPSTLPEKIEKLN